MSLSANKWGILELESVFLFDELMQFSLCGGGFGIGYMIVVVLRTFRFGFGFGYGFGYIFGWFGFLHIDRNEVVTVI